MLIEVVNCSVLEDELGGSLGADAHHPRNIVRRVTHEGENVADVLRLDPLDLEDIRGQQAQVLVNIKQFDVIIEKLGEVLVLGDDADMEVGLLLAQTRHQGGDDIVGLDPLHPHHGDVHLIENAQTAIDLGAEVVGGLIAIGLVFGIDFAAERFLVAAHIDGHRKVIRLVVPHDLENHAHKAERHVRRLLGDRAGHAGPNGVIRAKELRVAVDEVE